MPCTYGSQQQAVSGDHEVVLGAQLAVVGWVQAGQFATVLGQHRTEALHVVPHGGVKAIARDADKDRLAPEDQPSSVLFARAT